MRGFPAAGCQPKLDFRTASKLPSRAASDLSRFAPTVFSVRIKSIRTENTVMGKAKTRSGLIFPEIADFARMAFSFVQNR